MAYTRSDLISSLAVYVFRMTEQAIISPVFDPSGIVIPI